MKKLISAYIQGFLLLSVVQTSNAQIEQDSTLILEEVLITAQRRVSDLQATPISVSAFGENDLERLQIVESTDLQKFVPGLTIQPGIGAPGKVDLYLRGAGNQDGSIILSETGVGVYIDDVYMPRLSVGNIEALELERIEVLRGPQGTLYGRNSMTGAIKYVTKKPDGDTYGSLNASYGRYGAYNVRGHVNVPLIDNYLAMSTTASYRETGNWYKNTQLNEQRGNREVLSLNTTFALISDSPLSAKLTVSYADEVNDGGEAVHLDAETLKSVTGNFRNVASPFDTFGGYEQYRVAMDVAYQFSNSLSLRSISGYQNLKEQSAFDLTGVGLLNRSLQGEVKIFNQDIHLRGTSGGSKFDWLVGLSIFRETGHQSIGDVVFYSSRAPTILDVDTDSNAVFFEGTYQVNDQLSMTVGARYTDDEKVLDAEMATPADTQTTVPVDAVNNASDTTTRISIDYQMTDRTFVFASFSEGFKAGSFNGLAVLNPVALGTGYDPETVLAYEVGVKTELMANRMRLNVNVFHNDFSSLQGLNTSDAGYTTVRNIAGADLYGIEAEFQFIANEGLSFSGSIARQWDGYKDIDPTSVVNESFRMNRVSEWTANIGFENRFFTTRTQGVLGVNGYWAYRSDYFNDIVNSPIFRTDSHSLVDASLFYESADNRWRVSLAGKNILGEDVYIKGLGVIRTTGVPNSPLTWSLNIKRTFL